MNDFGRLDCAKKSSIDDNRCLDCAIGWLGYVNQRVGDVNLNSPDDRSPLEYDKKSSPAAISDQESDTQIQSIWEVFMLTKIQL